MTAPPVTPYRSALPPAHDGFPQLLRAEWTKLRTVPRWLITMLAAVVVTVLVSLLAAATGGGDVVQDSGPPPTAPDGTLVHDHFPFVHRTLTGDGSITARVSPPTGGEDGPEEWAKAGIMVKGSLKQGASYAAVMLTPKHGVRLQYDFVHDTAGQDAPGAGPLWLRLTRSGEVLTAATSADGRSWTEIGTAEPAGLPRTAQVGIFTATPGHVEVERQFGAASVEESPATATAVFDRVSVDGGRGDWRRGQVGPAPGLGGGPAPGEGPGETPGEGPGERPGEAPGEGTAAGPGGPGGDPNLPKDRVERTADGWKLTGTGDIAPRVPDKNLTQQSLVGTQLGLIPLAAVAVLFLTTEYRRGMIRTTLTASPRRGRVLAAKATVLAGVTFVLGLVAAALSFLLSEPVLRDGSPEPLLHPGLALTDGPVLRAVFGTAVLLAAVTVLALAAGALLRNTAAAVTLTVVLLVLPHVLLSGLPVETAHWVMRLTPIAGFAVQRVAPEYTHTATTCLPEDGCYPQGPWTGLALLCAWAVLALALAVRRLRRRDT